MCLPCYTPRDPEQGPLHQLLREHLATFLARRAEQGAFLPRHVTRELEGYVACGVLAYGFVRVRCPSCCDEWAVPFSCKGRGFCASCGGRRMAATAAHLVDHVLPPQPMRQWVLSLPHVLRFVLAYEADRLGRVLRVAVSCLFGALRRRLNLPQGKGGAITHVQYFGGSINLNPHFHILAVDGLYAKDGPTLRFHPLPGVDELDVAELEQTMAARILALCRRHGWLPPDESSEGAESAQREAGGASVVGRVAFGRRRGKRIRRLGRLPDLPDNEADPEEQRERPQGFSLFASPPVRATDRRRLEHLVRYMARPAICLDRLARQDDGRYTYVLRRPWRDGTTHIQFSASELIEKLVALVPPKGMHLLRYHGVLAPAASWRSLVVPGACRIATATQPTPTAAPRRGRGRWIPWAELMMRVFALDVLCCGRCGGRMKILACLSQPSVVEAILAARGLPTQPQPCRPAHRQLTFEL